MINARVIPYYTVNNQTLRPNSRLRADELKPREDKINTAL
jgi:hypothetical protein